MRISCYIYSARRVVSATRVAATSLSRTLPFWEVRTRNANARSGVESVARCVCQRARPLHGGRCHLACGPVTSSAGSIDRGCANADQHYGPSGYRCGR
jgi:hypothetical protein